MNTATARTYEEAFAAWTPFYAKQWTPRSNMARMLAAHEDIIATLKVWNGERTPYTGKLYAELDVIRGCLHLARKAKAIKRDHAHGKLVCADCGAPGERTGHMGCMYPQDR